MKKENAVELKDVEMHFNMSKEKFDSLKELFLRFMTKRLMFEDFVALDKVSLEIPKGDVFGIVGLNGSGKSTMLKIISGILTPTKGVVETNGVIAPLIELGAGFDLDLTARENIYLNGSVLGYSRKFMDEKFDDIVEFSELRDFLDTPMKNYSSGMVARIGFAIATITKPDILIVDEILAVGDFKFQEKCERRINDMINGDTTVIIVSHSIEQIERLCKHCVWLEKGKLKMIGEANEVCNAYKNQGN